MATDPARTRRLILAAAVAGFVLRAAFGVAYWAGKPLTHDEREYLVLARSIASGQGFAYGEDYETGSAQKFGRAPGYPLFLAAIGTAGALGTGAPASVPRRVQIAQAGVGALGVWLIGLIALRALGPRPAITAAALAALYPPLVWICAYALSEALFSTMALGTALLLDRAVDRADRERPAPAATALAVAAGLLAGAAILVRSVMLFFLPLAVLWLFWRRRAALALALVLATAVVVAPWTARNIRVHARFVLVASDGGVTFWTGNHRLARGEGDMAANPEIKRADLDFRAAHPGLTAEQREPLYYRDALRYIAQHPLWWAGLLLRKAFFTIVPIGPSYTLHSTKYLVATIASYGLILLGAAAGAHRLVRSPVRPTTLLLLAVSAVLVCLVFFPQERFRIPVIDPTLIVTASALAMRRSDAA